MAWTIEETAEILINKGWNHRWHFWPLCGHWADLADKPIFVALVPMAGWIAGDLFHSPLTQQNKDA